MINPITKENYSKEKVSEMAYNVKSRVIAEESFSYKINVIIHSYQLSLKAIMEIAESEGWNNQLTRNKQVAEEMIEIWSKALETVQNINDTLL